MYGQIDYLARVTGAIAGNQKIVASNIANAQTPGYVRQEASFSDVLGRMSNPYENSLSMRMGAMQPSALRKQTGKPVDMAQEFLELQKHFVDYSLVTRRLSTVFGNLRRATQVGR
jgi:flagellar basal body rod protein FlgB